MNWKVLVAELFALTVEVLINDNLMSLPQLRAEIDLGDKGIVTCM